MLVRRLRSRLRLSPGEFAASTDLDEAGVIRIESGEYQPPLSEVEQLPELFGLGLSVRIEVYDNHDDVLELNYLRDA